MKNFFKENYKFIIFFVLFYFVMSHTFSYTVYTPGGRVDMSKRISGDNLYSEKGSLNMTYVRAKPGNIPNLVVAFFLKDYDIIKDEYVNYPGTDTKETFLIDKIYMKEAISNAEYNAYKEANIDFKVKKCNTKITVVYPESKSSLKPGDILYSYDDIKFTNDSNFTNYINSKNIGDIVNIGYKRDNKILNDKVELTSINGFPKIGIGTANICSYTTSNNIKVKVDSSESGPSGGLITSLEIYNRITKEDITKGLTIMGTGTIDRDGNVGVIGGVKYKLLGAYKKKADVFICPLDNLDEAKKVVKDRNLNIKVIGVATFKDALDELKKL